MKSIVKIAAAAIAASLALAAPVSAAYVQVKMNHVPYGNVKIVIPVTAVNPLIWNVKLHNLMNAENAIKAGSGTLQARVVLYARGIAMLQQPMAPGLVKLVDALRKDGVQFEICNNSLEKLKVDWHSLYGVKETDVVPSGFLEVGWLANHGWAVDPLN
ncbi:MAG: DsrE family protein [Hyphomicrobiales bacterium]|nr:DsrE family protein [Hyphomicrobiales bacterium]